MIINDENYEAVVAEGKPMMLDFWATWCGPCKKIGPDIEALAQEYEGQVIVGKVNVEEADDLATKFKIRNVPTVLYIKNGEVVDKIVGATTKDKFEEKLKALLA
ncbi:MAG: thioredoxin [Bacteroidaceae bacterium]|jgi:thioredoxin 1|nr:thioredoxin [Bacteroidaceae bacterium]